MSFISFYNVEGRNSRILEFFTIYLEICEHSSFLIIDENVF